MNRSIFKPILGGLFIGAAVFFAPFALLKLMFFFFIIGGIFRMLFWRRMYHYGRMNYYMVSAEKIRSMSEEEYTAFKSKMNNWQGNGCCHHKGYDNCNEPNQTV